ncbi:hypothetical protein [Streptomyces sp. SAS_270]|uniref:hypothetical protein n=1 Tax=Streptomyces sp. SAS_270 TaxID=3412748 RepID=UPI00403D1693
MGERHSHGGAPDRRAARPDAARPLDAAAPLPAHPGTSAAASTPGVDALLAAAVRAGAVDAEREARAVAAFRAARDQGAYAAHAARTRRRDDWRPRQEKTKRSLRATFAVLAASVTLGGVAVAAIGSSSDGDAGDQSRTRPSSSAPDHSAPDSANPAPPGSSAPGTTDAATPSPHPSQAQDTEAHCRAYEKVGGRGKALNSTAWQRLVDAAGGEDKVAAYCAAQLAENATGTGTDTSTDKGKGGSESNGNGAAGTARATPTPATPTQAATPKPGKSKGKP